ncbi:hypothetical protein BJV78DRAFT_1175951, partial [Lactifluus subvellereus]
VNILNIVFYRSPDHVIQSAGCSLGKALTWIMSQRIILHVRGTRRERFKSFNPDQTMRSSYDSINTASDYGIKVTIQESVFVDTKLADEGSIERGIYPSPRSNWDKGHAI